MCFVRRGERGWDSDVAEILAQNERMYYKSACRSCLSFFWIKGVINFTDKQLSSNCTLIHLLIHASKPTTLGQEVWKWELQHGRENFSNQYNNATTFTLCSAYPIIIPPAFFTFSFVSYNYMDQMCKAFKVSDN